ncbi:WXG100 family type VII secretion target [Kitasatospora viridis]|uniref:Type VII secretion system (Wss) protein ESAT-6 n=1 Tax=Kitasatospora viridis TaxID=281105 RepID=A0A561UMI7_9ACTN|nr:WXG100 family type VII secretion target [Kitasatospora viridis]TWG00583.1 type VII secretion system (Wss) protein ESAT-6 [Kitasatospora viridis]
MTESWVGGDIAGLQHMGSTLTGAKQQLDGIVQPLGAKVDSLVGDAGWSGDAASGFRSAWTTDAMTAGGFSELVEATGKVLTDLGNRLSAAESALQDAADTAQRKGVPVGPTGVPGELATNNPPSPKEQQGINDLHDYGTLYAEIMQTAQQARIDAAKALNDLYASIDPSQPMGKGDKITVADYLRGLWTAKTDEERSLGLDAAKELPDAQAKHDAALKSLVDEEAKFRTAEANLPKAFQLRGQWASAAEKLTELKTTISEAENGSQFLPYDKQLNYKLADATKGVKLMDDAPRFLKEIPVIDIAATVGGGLLEANSDHQEGWSWGHSLLVDVGGGLVGLGAGVAVAAGVVASLPVDGAVAVAAIGGTVVVGVGTFADKLFHEHWSEDIHNHGVVAGVWDGTMHAGAQTGKAIGGMVTGAGKAVWHGITSIF